jgi:hypothetical protein
MLKEFIQFIANEYSKNKDGKLKCNADNLFGDSIKLHTFFDKKVPYEIEFGFYKNDSTFCYETISNCFNNKTSKYEKEVKSYKKQLIINYQGKDINIEPEYIWLKDKLLINKVTYNSVLLIEYEDSFFSLRGVFLYVQ